MLPEKIIVNPTYKPSQKVNDLAIIRFCQQIPDIKTVGVACLPTDLSRTFANKTLLTPGWGLDESGKANLMTKLFFDRIKITFVGNGHKIVYKLELIT
jgi:hypothetical protein